MKWQVKKFQDLLPEELYEILKLRLEVFVGEQNCCAHEDLDNKDKKSYHLFTFDENRVIAYCRILPPGLSYEEASIGRVVVAKSYRRDRLGYQMMQEAIQFVENNLHENQIKISAQSYIIPFYESLGFKIISQEYLEENIPHVKMLRN